MSREKSEIYEFGEFRLDVVEHRLERVSGELNDSLPEKAFQTLVVLLRNSGTLVTKERLLSAVWPDVVVEENNLGKAIHAIRQFLVATGPDHIYIETIPKHGYRFVADVARIYDHETSRVTDSPSSSRVFPGGSPAYDLYVRGKVKAGSENTADTDDAIKVLEAAVAIDPYYAAAYAQLARAYNTRSFKFTSRSEAKVMQENADVAVVKALDLDPNLAEAHFARGLILWTKSKGFPHEQSITSFKRALELAPDDDETRHQLSMVYSHVGLLDEAQEEVAKAIEINPNNTMARFRVGVYTAWQCRFEKARAILKTVPGDVSPMLVDRVRTEVLIQLGSFDDAETIVDKYLGDNPIDEGGSLTSVKALLLAKAGDLKEAQKMIDRATEMGKNFGHFHHTAHNIASAYSAMGMLDESVKWLEYAADDGFPNYTYFASDPNLNGNRKHPPFIELMSKLKRQWQRFKELV
ncbi:MAG: winged helix-turn-helix domain-containing protein [Acidobacteria bacterium]|nr:winged helix-turn-helix domain-containing protein [Acidobacteriota bacterium]